MREVNKRSKNWIEDNRDMGDMAMERYCKQLASHLKGNLNWQICQISTGPLEGFNNKIKVLKRSIFGFTNDIYFNLRILALHEYKHRLLS